MKPVNFFLSLIILCWGGLALADTETDRFASLKKTEVNWRTGPGERFPIVWVYQEKGYPVKVLDEYDNWRQVREADGSIGWVHKKMLSDLRTALIQEEGSLTAKPNATSNTVAFIEPGTIARILRCPADTQFCLLAFKYNNRDIKGWYPRDSFWGISPGEEID